MTYDQLSSSEKLVLINALKSYSWIVSGEERNPFIEQLIHKVAE